MSREPKERQVMSFVFLRHQIICGQGLGPYKAGSGSSTVFIKPHEKQSSGRAPFEVPFVIFLQSILKTMSFPALKSLLFPPLSLSRTDCFSRILLPQLSRPLLRQSDCFFKPVNAKSQVSLWDIWSPKLIGFGLSPETPGNSCFVVFGNYNEAIPFNNETVFYFLLAYKLIEFES
ncbi:unnamed protein product [Ilex paraguariensis]|uniref:Uncharacterized protein n=1 Tax=Ilex paraguariensis TaxID=185542 RepID=A0ABC8R0X5_9AQUA